MIKNKKILVVDDSKMCRRVITDILNDYDYQVTTASNGLEALKSLKENCYRLLITDMEMPGMTGIDLLKKVNTLFPETWVIIITGNGEMDFHFKSISLETCQYLNKPVSINKLMRTVGKVFSHSGEAIN